MKSMVLINLAFFLWMYRVIKVKKINVFLWIKHSSQTFQTEHPYAKQELGSFAAKPRENVACRFCTSLHRKRFCMMTRVQRRTNNVVRFASVILGIFAICQIGKIGIFQSSNIAICQPCNTAICDPKKNTTICQILQLKITSTVWFLQMKFSKHRFHS